MFVRLVIFFPQIGSGEKGRCILIWNVMYLSRHWLDAFVLGHRNVVIILYTCTVCVCMYVCLKDAFKKFPNFCLSARRSKATLMHCIAAWTESLNKKSQTKDTMGLWVNRHEWANRHEVHAALCSLASVCTPCTEGCIMSLQAWLTLARLQIHV